MTANDLLLMEPVTMIFQHPSTGCFIEIRKLMSHGLNCFKLKLIYFVTVFHIKGKVFKMKNFTFG